MPIVSLKVMPRTRECDVSVSKYVAETVKILERLGLEPIVTPDTTVFRLDGLERLGEIMEAVHGRLKERGAVRILTLIMIDDRVDKPDRDPRDLVGSVVEKIGK